MMALLTGALFTGTTLTLLTCTTLSLLLSTTLSLLMGLRSQTMLSGIMLALLPLLMGITLALLPQSVSLRSVLPLVPSTLQQSSRT